MGGIGILLLLIFAAALPIIVVYLVFRAKKSAVTLPWFLAAIAAGVISVSAASLLQYLFFSPDRGIQGGLWPVFFGVFVRIAFVEEFSRLLTLIPLFMLVRRNQQNKMEGGFAAALGLSAGLGFAAMENAFYGMADIDITLLRGFTAAPLHAACGIRAGMAVFLWRQRPVKAFCLFAFAVLIHGAYNLMIISPALPSILAAAVAFTALFGSLHFLKTEPKGLD